MPAKSLRRPHCAIDGCHRRAMGRGWCSGHYNRWRRHWDPAITRGSGRLISLHEVRHRRQLFHDGLLMGHTYEIPSTMLALHFGKARPPCLSW
jgi:hypothetical protein